MSVHNKPHTTVGFRITWGPSSRLPLFESISPFAELPFLHSTLFQWAANHVCPPAHIGGTWPKLGQSDFLFCKFGFWMERKTRRRKRGGTESSNDPAQGLPWFLPRKWFIIASILWPYQVQGKILLALCQPELVSEAWKQRQRTFLKFRDRRAYF